MDFSDRILIIHPTAFDLGRSVLFLGLIVIAIGVATCFTGTFVMAPLGWIIISIPTLVVGGILVASSVTKP